MPSIQYYNASAPFWDFVADMENRATNNQTNNNNTTEEENENEWAGPWGGAPWGAFPFRGRRGGHHHHHGPPPPPPPPAEGETDPEEGPSTDRGPPPPFSEKPDENSGPEHHHPRGHHGPYRRCGRGGPRGRGGFGGWGGRGGGWGGGRGHFHPYMQAFGPLAEIFQSQLFGEENNNKEKGDETFTPNIDVFDTPTSFVVHVSLPGAKKDDVGVNWDAEKSELSVGGVVYRPGDEEFLKTLALDERKVGAFERKVRLGSRAQPAQVDVEGIVARMEDGVLTVEVPKVGSEGFVEVRKVDIE